MAATITSSASFQASSTTLHSIIEEDPDQISRISISAPSTCTQNTTDNAACKTVTFVLPDDCLEALRLARNQKPLPPPPKSVLRQPTDLPNGFVARWRQLLTAAVVFVCLSVATVAIVITIINLKRKDRHVAEATFAQFTSVPTAPSLDITSFPYKTRNMINIPSNVKPFQPTLFPGIDIPMSARPRLIVNPSFDQPNDRSWLNRKGCWSLDETHIYPDSPRASLKHQRYQGECDLVQTIFSVPKGLYEVTFLYAGTVDREDCVPPGDMEEPAWFWARAGGGRTPGVILSTNRITLNTTRTVAGYEGFLKAGFRIQSDSTNFTVAFSGYNFCGSWNVAQVGVIQIPTPRGN